LEILASSRVPDKFQIYSGQEIRIKESEMALVWHEKASRKTLVKLYSLHENLAYRVDLNI